MTDSLPRVLFFNINGSGLGHLSRCLAYARRLQGRAKSVFFSLASAVEIINDMGFEADYFVSPFWSRSHINAWNRELVIRMGLILEGVKPDVAVFDGTWPFPGFMHACDVAGVPLRVWSNRGLHKKDFEPVPVRESAFDLVLEPGEIGTTFAIERDQGPGRKVLTPPVTVLRRDELLDRDQARVALGLPTNGRIALLSLGPGNVKDVTDIARGLIEELRARGFIIAWARAPISVRDTALPDDVIPLSVYPLVRYMRAFDVFAGAAGYNTCCEVIQASVPSLLVPNTLLADDQARRAEILARHAPVVVSPCHSAAECRSAMSRLLTLADAEPWPTTPMDLDGAERAADEIIHLVSQSQTARR